MAQPKLEALVRDARGRERYQSEARSARTLVNYKMAHDNFVKWCERHGHSPDRPAPALVGEFMADLGNAAYAASTIKFYMVAICVTYKLLGWRIDRRHPDIWDTLQGIYRVNGKEQKQAKALTVEQIREISVACGGTILGLRDRAMILLGFAGALRRTEIVGIDAEHLTWTNTGVTIFIPKAKEDQAKRGARVSIPFGTNPETCAVTAVQNWMLNARISSGPIFRRMSKAGRVLPERASDKAVWRTVLGRAKEAGLTGTPTSQISAHSLRSGFITAAYKAGILDEEIMAHTRHRSLRRMRGYVRQDELNEVSPAGRIGL